jgi:RecB family endonuclease NucS
MELRVPRSHDEVMRLVIATCEVAYEGRLAARLPLAKRLLLVKADGSVSIHADDRAYKPLNWMSPPCTAELGHDRWIVRNRKGETLTISLAEVHVDVTHDLGAEPGLEKDQVERELQALLAAAPEVLGSGTELIRREHETGIGPVDLLCHDATGFLAVEVKRRGEVDGVEQLARYLRFLGRDPRLRPIRGMLVAQRIAPQARTLAADRDIACLEVDFDALRGRAPTIPTLFG